MGEKTRDRARKPAQIRAASELVITIAFVTLLVCAAYAPRSAQAQSFCASCEVQLGLGGTYHYWGATDGVVLPVSVTWSESRYEFGLFRVTTQQMLQDHGSRYARVVAEPYWGVSLSRRWRLFESGPLMGFFGFGLAGKTESDALSITRWDFATQLGLRFRLPGNRVVGELTMRHWSNAGVRLPNHGQDFATLTVRINPGRFAVAAADKITIGPSFDLDHSLTANNYRAEGYVP